MGLPARGSCRDAPVGSTPGLGPGVGGSPDAGRFMSLARHEDSKRALLAHPLIARAFLRMTGVLARCGLGAGRSRCASRSGQIGL